jgi:hypothetical protein
VNIKTKKSHNNCVRVEDGRAKIVIRSIKRLYNSRPKVNIRSYLGDWVSS